MATTCYLCGQPILGELKSGDHVVPSALITRSQPKAKGFDYAGKLPTHEECNNRFGPETYLLKALDLLELLTSGNGNHKFQHRHHPSIQIHALDASKLPNFTQRDLSFFKLIDIRNVEQPDWSNPAFYTGKPRTNVKRDALYVALSVLAKSAAALLINRKLHAVPPNWKIYAVPYSGATGTLDFDDVLGATKPFDVGIKVWLRPLDSHDWLVLYRANSVHVYLVFVFSIHNALARLRELFSDAEIFEFTGTSVNELLTRRWQKVHLL